MTFAVKDSAPATPAGHPLDDGTQMPATGRRQSGPRRVAGVVVLATVVFGGSVQPHAQVPTGTGPDRVEDLAARARGAEQVVVGTITRVEPLAVANEHGDRLIVSRTTVVIEEAFKGTPSGTLTLDIEGGTLGDVTLTVSDVPLVRPGDRCLFFVTRSSQGVDTLYDRGRGLLRLTPTDTLEESGLTLETIRLELSSSEETPRG